MPRTAAAPKPVRRRSNGLRTRAEIVAAAERHFAALPWLTLNEPVDPWSRPELEKRKQEILLAARGMLGIDTPPTGTT